MNTQHLKYVIEVERTGSISQAAENLYMGQPNLSKAIKELECSLGITIFKRTSKGVIPTEKGSQFLSSAKNILLQIDEMESRFNPLAVNRIPLKISVPRTAYYSYNLTDFISSYSDEKEVEVLFRETNAKKTIDGIAYAEYNLGIVRYQTIYEPFFVNLLEEASVEYATLMEFGGVILLSENEKNKAQTVLEKEDLLALTEVACADTLVPYAKNTLVQKADAILDKNRILVNERASQLDAVRNIPATFMWSSPMPTALLSQYGLVQKKCNVANNNYKDILIYRKKYHFSDIEKQFIKHLEGSIELLSHLAKEYDVSTVVPQIIIK